jgi:hypothetical protein
MYVLGCFGARERRGKGEPCPQKSCLVIGGWIIPDLTCRRGTCNSPPSPASNFQSSPISLSYHVPRQHCLHPSSITLQLLHRLSMNSTHHRTLISKGPLIHCKCHLYDTSNSSPHPHYSKSPFSPPSQPHFLPLDHWHAKTSVDLCARNAVD